MISRLSVMSVIFICSTIALLISISGATAQETVSIGGADAVLLRPKAARASVILMPGGDGAIGAAPGGVITHLQGNQLVRTRTSYLARGLAVLVIGSGTNLSSAVQYMAAIKRPVTVVATSRGTLRAAQGIAAGARPDALVLSSGFLSPESGSGENVESILGSPSTLPRTLVIHHRQDTCKFTLPAGVDPFIKWSAGRARAVWVSGGIERGDPCEAQSHHGFNGLDQQIVSLAAGFR
jgi:hypothetical protein